MSVTFGSIDNTVFVSVNSCINTLYVCYHLFLFYLASHLVKYFFRGRGEVIGVTLLLCHSSSGTMSHN